MKEWWCEAKALDNQHKQSLKSMQRVMARLEGSAVGHVLFLFKQNWQESINRDIYMREVSHVPVLICASHLLILKLQCHVLSIRTCLIGIEVLFIYHSC